MKLGVLFSGGKDSVFATYRAMQRNQVACLITLISQNPDSYMFHTPNIQRTSLQAEALGLPLLSRPTLGEKEKELQDLEAAIADARDEYGIEGVVTGAIESVYQAVRTQRICQALDLWCFNPLWQINQVDYLRQLLSEGFQVIITGVFAYPFDASWLGQELTLECVCRLEELWKRYKVSPSGEGGELETMVLDGPIFQKRLEILRSSRSYCNFSGRLLIEEIRLVDK